MTSASIHVLDASSMPRFTDKEAGFGRVRELLVEAASGKAELLLSAVNWGEIVGALYKKAGGQSPRISVGSLTANLGALPLTIIPVSRELSEEAAAFKYDFKVPSADAFAGSLALRENATLVTADYDFKSVPSGTMNIEFLAAE